MIPICRNRSTSLLILWADFVPTLGNQALGSDYSQTLIQGLAIADRSFYVRALRHAAIAQLVRALDCGSRGPPFEPGWRYQRISLRSSAYIALLHPARSVSSSGHHRGAPPPKLETHNSIHEARHRFLTLDAKPTWGGLRLSLWGTLINRVTAWLFAAGRKDDIKLRGAFMHMAACFGTRHTSR
jgi:hypothetical protein